MIIYEHCHNCFNGCLAVEAAKKYEKAQKEGRIIEEWHPFPEVEPKSKGEYAIWLKDSSTWELGYYNESDKVWWLENVYPQEEGMVVAWTNLPKYPPYKENK